MASTRPIRDSFEADLRATLSEVRESLALTIEAAGPKSASVSAIAEAFGVHRKLAWQVSRVVYGADPFEAARHVPTGRALEPWLRAVDDLGAESAAVAVRDAAERFEAMLARHAATRAELEMLLDSCAARGGIDDGARWRQQAFQGNSFTWGAHCRLLAALCVLLPSDDRPCHFHAVQARGLIGFRQTRRGVRWVVNESVVADDAARVAHGLERRPLDPDAAARHSGTPVLPEFCSDPLPVLERRSGPEGIVRDEFAPGELGQRGERSVVTAEIVRNIGPVHATRGDRVAHFGTAVRTPAEMLHFDLFVRAGLFGTVEREVRVFSDLASPVAFGDEDRLSVPAELVSMGRGLGAAQCREMPSYPRLARAVFDMLGANSEDYDLFRVRLAYPPMPATVMIRHPLLDAGEL